MGRGLLATLAACIAMAAGFVSAGDAAARDRRVVTFPGAPLTADFRLQGGNGYDIDVYGSRHQVTMTASLGHAAAQYEVKGLVTKDRIEARVGKLGRVSVAFRETSVRRIPSSFLGCKGGPEVIRRGVFVGTIRFRGEGGYTEADARSAPGTTSVTPRWRCPVGNSDTAGDFNIPDQVNLAAVCGQEGFAAIGHRSLEDGPPVFPDDPSDSSFLAYSLEPRGRMTVTRLALAFGDRSNFLFDDPFTFATVKPPPPFHGTATLARDPAGGGSWEGSLSVSFPGRQLDLIDPRFRVLLKRYRQERVEKGYVLPPRAPCRAGDSHSLVPPRLLSRILGTVNS